MAKIGNKSTENQDDKDRPGDNAASEPRDDQGRFTNSRERNFKDVRLPEFNGRNAAIGALGAGIAVAAVAVGSALFRTWNEQVRTGDSGGQAKATDDDREISSSEPGAEGAVTAADVIDEDKREAFAPATMPVPTRIEAMGNGDE